eukprot:GHVS01011423.1.p1 GENE.GHVS01011423.1~~GHVS01011423.1.p1  ORF type:complete len:478 (+),score=148.72 GHVS01011423.1:113-1435(+)
MSEPSPPPAAKKVIVLRRKESSPSGGFALESDERTTTGQQNQQTPSTTSTTNEAVAKSLEERTKEYHQVRARIFGNTGSASSDQAVGDSTTTTPSTTTQQNASTVPVHDDRNDPAYIRYSYTHTRPPPPPPPPLLFSPSRSNSPAILQQQAMTGSSPILSCPPQPLMTSPMLPTYQHTTCCYQGSAGVTHDNRQHPLACMQQPLSTFQATFYTCQPTPQDQQHLSCIYNNTTPQFNQTISPSRMTVNSPPILPPSAAHQPSSTLFVPSTYHPSYNNQIGYHQHHYQHNTQSQDYATTTTWCAGGARSEHAAAPALLSSADIRQCQHNSDGRLCLTDQDYDREIGRYEKRFDMQGLSEVSVCDNNSSYARVQTYDMEFPPLLFGGDNQHVSGRCEALAAEGDTKSCCDGGGTTTTDVYKTQDNHKEEPEGRRKMATTDDVF